MAAVKEAGLSRDKKGQFRSEREVERREMFKKKKADTFPGRDQDICFEDVYKISGRRVVELDLMAETLDRGCKACGNWQATSFVKHNQRNHLRFRISFVYHLL